MATAACTCNSLIHADESGTCWAQTSWQSLSASGSAGSSRPFVLKFTVPAAQGETAGRKLTFTMPVYLTSAQTSNTSITMDYYVTNGAPNFDNDWGYATDMSTKGTVIASGKFSMSGLNQQVQKKEFITGSMTLPASGGTYYLWLRNGGKVISIGTAGVVSTSYYSVTMTYTSTTVTTGWSISGNLVIGTGSVVVSIPTLSGANASNYHRITYTFGSKTGTLHSELRSGQSVSWTPPYSIAEVIPSATSAYGSILCITYSSSGVEIGRNIKNLTITLPNNSATQPSFSCSISPVDPGGNAMYVQTMGHAVLNLSGISGKYGASVVRYSASIADNWSSGNVGLSGSSASVSTSKFSTSGSKAVSVTITDSRGFTITWTVTIAIQAYSRPSINSFQAFRTASASSTTQSNDGTYLRVIISVSGVSSVGGKNAVRGTLSASSSISGLPSSVTSSYSSNFKISDATSYSLSFSYGDDYITVTATQTVGSIAVPLNLRYDGRGIGLGMYAQGNNRLDIGFNTFIHGSGSIFGDLWVGGNIGGTIAGKSCSDMDFNNLKQNGIYYGYKNMANAYWQNQISVLEVLRYSDDWVVQRQTRIIGAPDTAIRTYHSGNTWSPWYHLPTVGTDGGLYAPNFTVNVLFNGNWTSGDIIVNDTRKFVSLIIVGKPGTDGHFVSMPIPVISISHLQLAGIDTWFGFRMAFNASDGSIRFSRDGGSGCINLIYGVIKRLE